jgi:peptide/nickel transport system permease protein
MFSAYRRGRVDTILNTGSYIFLAFPALVAVIAIVSFWKPSNVWKITLIIGVFGAPLIFRIVRAATLSYATRDFVLAAKALGASDRRILAREILPNIMPTIISFFLIAVATIIVLEGTLAFLGLSVSPPTPSWGNMLNEGSQLLVGAKGQTNVWLVIFPATAMFLLLFSLNVIADKLRAYFDVTEIKL